MKLSAFEEKKKKSMRIGVILISIVSLTAIAYLMHKTFASYQFTQNFKTIEGNVIVKDKFATMLLKKETGEQTASAAKAKIANKNQPTNEGTEDTPEEKGLYQGEDDYGTSYYYHGNVTNNYVDFAGYRWRILRINGDGTIRLIYEGTEEQKEITTAAFNSSEEDIKYLGYTYKEEINAETKETKEQDSTAKQILENWYTEHLSKPEIESFLADEVFCNDRSTVDLEADANLIPFQSYTRINTLTPSLKCQNKNDQYTMDPLKGNSLLKKAIGLLTVDEAMYAGITKEHCYLDSTQSYWTMTPNSYSADLTQNFGLWIIGGETHLSYAKMTEEHGLRPVINIKADVTAIGDGTKESPYMMEQF